MKVCFVISECENYAVMLFSSLLKQQGHQVYLIFDPRLFRNDEINQPFLARIFDIRKQNIQKIKQIDPDLIGFSVYTQDYQWALGMARMIKKELPQTPIIFGGIHCILCPEEVLKEDCVDIVCVGEGESALCELADFYVGNGWFLEEYTSIKNLQFKGKKYRNPLRSLIQDLDTLPFPDRDLFYEQRPLFKKGYTISTGRGCPYSCTFCASDSLNRQYREQDLGNPVRQRSVENVIGELIWAKERYNYKTISFTDDVFTLNVNWLRQFAKDFKDWVDTPYNCTANPGTIKDEEIHLLKQSGCQHIGFGMQSCNEDIRTNLLNRRGTNARIKFISGLCHRLGIGFSFDHIFNIPTESRKSQEQALEFYNQTKPNIIYYFDMTYLPKIKLNDYLDDKTKEEVNNGKAKTSMLFEGVNYYATMFALIPLLPKSFIDFLIKYKIKLVFPFCLRLLLKDISRAIEGRWREIYFPIRLLIVNILDNMRIKCLKKYC